MTNIDETGSPDGPFATVNEKESETDSLPKGSVQEIRPARNDRPSNHWNRKHSLYETEDMRHRER